MAVAWAYTDCVGTWKYRDIFIGKSPKDKIDGNYSGGYGRKFFGNSILIEINHLQYVWIGNRIIEFTSQASIKKFVSPVGNNDVVYPYAIDVDNMYYLMIENTIVDGVEKGMDPYDAYYGHKKCNDCQFHDMNQKILVERRI